MAESANEITVETPNKSMKIIMKYLHLRQVPLTVAINRGTERNWTEYMYRTEEMDIQG